MQRTEILANAAHKTPKRSLARATRWGELIAELAVKIVAIGSIASVLLILIFVGKEALPLLTSSEVHERGHAPARSSRRRRRAPRGNQ